jgi:RNA polymerase sigma-70 factor, ECF subfamily
VENASAITATEQRATAPAAVCCVALISGAPVACQNGQECPSMAILPQGTLQEPGDAFERLVEVYYTSLYRFAMTLTGRESDACDLTQQTFLIWAQKGHQLQDRSKVKAWLFTSMYREYLQQFRRSKRFVHLNLEEVQNELPSVPPCLSQIETPAIRQAFGKLDRSLRAAVALFYLEDYSYREIAQILEVPLGTVKSRLSRGIAQLQKLLTAPARRRISRGN